MGLRVPANGTPEIVLPRRGKRFTRLEAERHVGGPITILQLSEQFFQGDILLVNREGEACGLRFNCAASDMAARDIVGDVLVVSRQEMFTL